MSASKTRQQGTILVVDDNTINLGVLFDYLQTNQFRVLVAQSGPAAIELLADEQPDIILLDILMPGMDGFETCRRIKEDPRTSNIPIIFMTAVSDTVDKVRGFELGAVDYVTKPFQHEEVLARVQTHLTLLRLRRNLESKNAELEAMNRNLETLVEEKTRQLIQQEKTAVIGRMIQGLAHNMKTPLAVIHNAMDVLRIKIDRMTASPENKGDSQQDRELLTSMPADLDLMGQAYDRIMAIIKTLMTKSRMDQQEGRKLLDINDLLRQEIEFLKADKRFKSGVQKQIDLAADMPLLPLVYSNITQVIENLVSNALDAMWNMPDPTLAIISRADERNVYIDIRDNGPGIPADRLSQIFDPFYTTKPLKGEEKEGEPTGTGLGLHTCVELLKPFSGRIEVVSEVGQGSTFTVVLPREGQDE